MKEEIKRWIKMAKDDFDSAEANFKIKKYYVCVLLCQQSIEKALKAVLLKKTGKIIKVHDLYLLGEKVDLPESILKKCDQLSDVYIDSRYGDVGKLPSEKYN